MRAAASHSFFPRLPLTGDLGGPFEKLMPLSTIQAGDLRHVVDIVAPNARQDSFGGNGGITDASVVATVRASIEDFTGREAYSGQQVVSEITHIITIRWMPDIVAAMSVRWFDERYRFFQIQDIRNPDKRHRRRMLALMCVERDDSAREQAP